MVWNNVHTNLFVCTMEKDSNMWLYFLSGAHFRNVALPLDSPPVISTEITVANSNPRFIIWSKREALTKGGRVIPHFKGLSFLTLVFEDAFVISVNMTA